MDDKQLATFVDWLFEWYEEHERDLPWRDDPSPYAVWVSEVMLQQTTVPAVKGRFERWMDRFPTVESVAKASEQEVLAEWEGLGYYQRASRLHAAARMIMEEHDGEIPQSSRALRDLPGIGPYIAAAVRSIAFGYDEVAVDANLCRVFMRLMALEGQASEAVVRRQVEEIARQALPEGQSSRFNQSLMDFGSLVCQATGPTCGHCFATDLCRAYQRGLQEDIPKRRSRKLEKIDTAVAVFVAGDSIYIQQRPRDGLFGGMWEFPGGKVEEGEVPEEAVKREVQEELGGDCIVHEKVTSFLHHYTRFEVTLHAFLCETNQCLVEDEKHRWVGLGDVEEYPMPSANRTLIDELQRRL